MACRTGRRLLADLVAVHRGAANVEQPAEHGVQYGVSSWTNPRVAEVRYKQTAKQSLKPINSADYTVTFNGAELARLNSIFPNGVCDWSGGWTRRRGAAAPCLGRPENPCLTLRTVMGSSPPSGTTGTSAGPVLSNYSAGRQNAPVCGIRNSVSAEFRVYGSFRDRRQILQRCLFVPIDIVSGID
jgi:hypothetical protein